MAEAGVGGCIKATIKKTRLAYANTCRFEVKFSLA